MPTYVQGFNKFYYEMIWKLAEHILKKNIYNLSHCVLYLEIQIAEWLSVSHFKRSDIQTHTEINV